MDPVTIGSLVLAIVVIFIILKVLKKAVGLAILVGAVWAVSVYFEAPVTFLLVIAVWAGLKLLKFVLIGNK